MIRTKPLLPGTKRMKRRHRACGNPTIAQQAHQDKQRAHGCAMCRLLGFSFKDVPEGFSPCGVSEIHHCTTGDLHGQLQEGQDRTLCLGSYHHRAVPMGLYRNADAMRAAGFGPSLAAHKRDFLNVLQDNLGERSTEALQAWIDAQLPEVA